MNPMQNLNIKENNNSTMQSSTNLMNLATTEHHVGNANTNNSKSRRKRVSLDSAGQSSPMNRNQFGRNTRHSNSAIQSHNCHNSHTDAGSSGEITQSVQVFDRSRQEPGKIVNLHHKSPGGSANAKHRQRKKTNQLIEGMSSLVPLEIGLHDGEIQSSSQRSSGRNNIRKMNLTHMINRVSPNSDSKNLNKNHPNQRRNKPTSYRDHGIAHKFSKQQFLQANCQFVVLNGYDYSIHLVDPDWPVDWDRIEEIKFKQCATTETTCPICLESPVAAKITKCGHIYCWTCMLHYLSLSDDKCRQCPICFEFVYKNDLRSVVSHSFIAHMVDTEIDMRLMVRRKGCVTVEPYIIGYQPEILSHDEQAQKQSVIDYCSQQNLFAVDSETVIRKIVDREYRELMTKLNSDREEPEVCFIEQALKMLEGRKLRLIEMSECESNNMMAKPKQNQETEQMAHNNLDLSNSYLFYQSCDGQHIYLNPFSTKILCHEYKSLENCPLEIRAKVLQMDWISMSDAWRKRFRYLSHLPLTCEFRLIEIDFEKSNLISKSTFNLFSDQIKSRETARERIRREERKREKIIRVEQDRKIYGIQPSMKININNPDQFPSVSDERYIGLSLATTDYVMADETFGLSSDDDESEVLQNVALDQTSAVSSTLSETKEPEIDSAVSNVALSFREIQLQEAAALDAIAQLDTRQTSSWGRGAKHNPANANHQFNHQTAAVNNSFAQLLVNAKTSKQEWTVKPSCSKTHNIATNSTNTATSSGYTNHDDQFGAGDDQEELKAPGLFTISDFIDSNVVSSSNKKWRAKQKGSGKNN